MPFAAICPRSASLRAARRRTDDEVQELIVEADLDGDGQISFNEFYRVMKKRGDNPLDDWDSDDDA